MPICLLTTSCSLQEKVEKQEKAQKEADYIIAHLDRTDVISYFPEESFPKAQTEQLVKDIGNNCDWTNRKGHFVDYTTMLTDGKSNVAFIYEYSLKCDSLRLILIYNIDQQPKLFKFQIQPLEQENLMVVDKEKQMLKLKILQLVPISNPAATALFSAQGQITEGRLQGLAGRCLQAKDDQDSHKHCQPVEIC